MRIVDFVLSNSVNSGIRKIALATQYKAHSLIRHCQLTWNFLRVERNEFLDILPASQRTKDGGWYRGTADAVFQNIDIIDGYGIEFIMILAADHVYKMDYEIMLEDHVSSGADMTIACLSVPEKEAYGFGILQVDENDVATAFVEKPESSVHLCDRNGLALASMGIYVFKWNYLRELLENDAQNQNSGHDFGQDIIPSIVASGKVKAHRFENSCVQVGNFSSYWRDVGTLDAYWKANLDLTDFTPELNLYNKDWPIWTLNSNTPPAKFIHDEDHRRGSATNSVIGNGCIVSGTMIRNSLLSSDVQTNSYTRIVDSVINPDVVIQRHVKLKKTIIDRNTTIPQGIIIGYDLEEDKRWFTVTENGVVLVNQDMIDSREDSW
jgi:glucose-1-phosphate adenylyltransferase